jgi:hypothetical protein
VSRSASAAFPLIGTGDWNDGLNRVGRGVGARACGSAGSSMPTCDGSPTSPRARGSNLWPWPGRNAAPELREHLETEAWDGDWYRRAFFDDGTPLGSSDNPECRIDSIAQSWSVIHGGGPAEPRAQRAMASVEEYLVHRGRWPGALFTPPFDNWEVDPGYIKGYLPGVRENGGQYTHAAIWSVIAFATLGDGDRAGELFSPQPDQPCQHPGGSPPLPGRAVRGGGRCLLRAAPRRSGRMDLVHGRRRGGCTGQGWSGSSASGCAAPASSSIPACPGPGESSRSPSATTPPSTRSGSQSRRRHNPGVTPLSPGQRRPEVRRRHRHRRPERPESGTGAPADRSP